MNNDRPVIGIAAVMVGLLLLVGAMRGTWGKIWQDVVLGTPSVTAGAGQTLSQAAQAGLATGQSETVQPANSGLPPGSVGPLGPAVPTNFFQTPNNVSLVA